MPSLFKVVSEARLAVSSYNFMAVISAQNSADISGITDPKYECAACYLIMCSCCLHPSKVMVYVVNMTSEGLHIAAKSPTPGGCLNSSNSSNSFANQKLSYSIICNLCTDHHIKGVSL